MEGFSNDNGRQQGINFNFSRLLQRECHVRCEIYLQE
jgi:hypothetical protein